MMLEPINARLEHLIGQRSVLSCAQAAGIPNSTLRTYVRGNVPIPAHLVERLANALDGSPHWLLTGRGTMWRATDHLGERLRIQRAWKGYTTKTLAAEARGRLRHKITPEDIEAIEQAGEADMGTLAVLAAILGADLRWILAGDLRWDAGEPAPGLNLHALTEAIHIVLEVRGDLRGRERAEAIAAAYQRLTEARSSVLGNIGAAMAQEDY